MPSQTDKFQDLKKTAAMDGWRINKKGREPETIEPGPIRSPQGFLGCDITRGAVMDNLRLTFLRGNKPKEVTFR